MTPPTRVCSTTQSMETLQQDRLSFLSGMETQRIRAAEGSSVLSCCLSITPRLGAGKRGRHGELFKSERGEGAQKERGKDE